MSSARAGETTMAEQTFKRIAEKQRALFAEAAKQGDKLDEASFKTQAQELVHDYERFLRDNPKHASAHAAYGYLLGKVGMRKEAAAILLKANQLDPDIALVKNQLGNYLAEEGRPREAVNYFLAAIKLEPNEPLYHYQLGTLLHEARDDFLKGGEWTRAGLDQSMRKAFERAVQLAPDRFEFAYRHAECFYDLSTPDWETALKLWAALEEKAPTAIERQTMRLHAANVLLKMGRREHARSLLGAVDDPALQKQKQKLVAQLAETPKK
ncbi:MAG: tetratricopeptide repeat protein [Verrucomicrobia bacterium]|nr:tetratricopeptide repeat protein [Verrucomicrobiota bacterium]